VPAVSEIENCMEHEYERLLREMPAGSWIGDRLGSWFLGLGLGLCFFLVSRSLWLGLACWRFERGSWELR
jgi:hypothetical protein